MTVKEFLKIFKNTEFEGYDISTKERDEVTKLSEFGTTYCHGWGSMDALTLYDDDYDEIGAFANLDSFKNDEKYEEYCDMEIIRVKAMGIGSSENSKGWNISRNYIELVVK